jgi:hypothetical protein
MSLRPGPVYEVTLFADPEVAAEVDRWLENHVSESLRLASIVDCHVFPLADNAAGRSGRICQHVLEADEALDDYLDNAAADIEPRLASCFGDKVEVHSRVLREDLTHDLPQDETPACLNCGTQLRGQYCGHCGQRSQSRLISLWELISDAFGDLFEIDSRLWQTVVPLMIRPGRLTHDYLKGRRARFMPPFRMYLVLSLVFFVVAFFDPREELGLFFEPATETESVAEAEESEDDVTEVEETEEECDIEADGMEDLPGFLARRLTIERMTRICEHIVADEGKSLTNKVVDNTPTALIVLLPLMALILKALYPLSRRYYVEHLLFFVHFHAFVFLLLTLQILLMRLATVLGVPELATALSTAAIALYIPVYVFVAMRRVYGQGRIATFLKFIVLTIAYIIGFSVIIGAAFVIAAFSI